MSNSSTDHPGIWARIATEVSQYKFILPERIQLDALTQHSSREIYSINGF